MSVHCQADDERFSFEAFTRHPFFTEVNRWIVERVISPGRQKIVDLGCGPGAVTKLILERLGGDARNVEVIGIDPSPSALTKARAAIHSQVVKFIEGSAEWVSRIVSSVDAVVFLNAIHLVPDKAQVIAEIRKTLNKDGVFAFNTTFFNGAYVDGTGAFWRRWVVRAVQVLRERGIEVKHSDHAVARQFLTPEEYSDLCVQAGFARPSVDLVRIEMPPESKRDIGRVSLFIEGALPRVPLGGGSPALAKGGARARRGCSLTTPSWTSGTAWAAPTPRTPRRPPAPGTGILITPDARRSRSKVGNSIPSACRMMISSRDVSRFPFPASRISNRNAPLHRPPIGRAASSISHAPRSLWRTSAWIGPSRRPSASTAACAHAAISCWAVRARRDRVT